MFIPNFISEFQLNSIQKFQKYLLLLLFACQIINQNEKLSTIIYPFTSVLLFWVLISSLERNIRTHQQSEEHNQFFSIDFNWNSRIKTRKTQVNMFFKEKISCYYIHGLPFSCNFHINIRNNDFLEISQKWKWLYRQYRYIHICFINNS